MTASQQPPVRQSSKDKKTIIAIIAGIILVSLLLFSGLFMMVQALSGHDWSHGLARQQSNDTLSKIHHSVASIENDAILDVSVENSNTSGHPFGHSLTVSVLVDAEKAPTEEAIDVIETEVIAAVREADVKDSYSIVIGRNVEATVISGAGSPETPITSADDIRGSSNRRVKLEVK